MIPGKKVWIETHVGGAARVRVVSEANEFCTRNSGSKLNQHLNIVPADLGTEDDDEVLLAAKFIAQSDRVLATSGFAGQGVGYGVLTSKECGDFALGAFRNPREVCGLTPQLGTLRVDHVQPPPVQAHISSQL